MFKCIFYPSVTLKIGQHLFGLSQWYVQVWWTPQSGSTNIFLKWKHIIEDAPMTLKMRSRSLKLSLLLSYSLNNISIQYYRKSIHCQTYRIWSWKWGQGHKMIIIFWPDTGYKDTRYNISTQDWWKSTQQSKKYQSTFLNWHLTLKTGAKSPNFKTIMQTLGIIPKISTKLLETDWSHWHKKLSYLQWKFHISKNFLWPWKWDQGHWNLDQHCCIRSDILFCFGALGVKGMGTPPCFSAIFTKGNNFCDPLFAFLEDEAPPNGVYSKWKKFAP